MGENEKIIQRNIVNNTKELRKLIIQHPELPLVVIAGSQASNEDYQMCCSYVKAEIGEFLDNELLDKAYTDRDELREDIEDYYYSDFDGTEREFDEYIDSILNDYVPYWIECILLYVDN